MSQRARRAVGVVSLFVAILLFCLPSFSQTNLGRILGTVTDQSGGVIVAAKVTVIDTERGINRALMTDDAGQYNAPNLIPGNYTIRVEAPGFQAFERQNVPVEVGQELHVDATLQPGAQTQTVTVTEAIPLINTTNAVVTSTIENQDINQLPLNGRNFQSMTDFRPGVQTKPGGGTDARYSNGQQSEENIWLLDGLFNKGTYGGNSVIGGGNLAGEGATLVPLDTIQEITFIENPKAEYGWGTGAIVNLGFKSGTNDLHGSAYAYGRDDALAARNPFAAQKPGTALEQFGMSLGGPIRKNKIFFFGGYEGKRVTSSTTALSNEPTTASLGGNATNSFPDAITALEALGYCNPAAGAACAKPLSQLSLNLAGCTLPAGLTGAATCNAANGLFNYSAATTGSIPIQIPNFQHTDNMLEKIDYHISDRNSLNGEYFFGTGQTYSNAGTPVEPWWGATTPVRGQGFTVVDVWTPNSAWVNEARGGYHRYNQIIGFGECANNGAPPATDKSSGVVTGSPDYATAFGLVTGSSQPCAMPFLTISGFTGLGTEQRGYEPRLENAYKGEDAVSYTRGKHIFKFGVEYRNSRLAGGANGSAQGAINFGGTGAPAPFAGATALEQFLVGVQNQDQILSGNPLTHTIQHFYAGFAQDDWRVTNKLTLNLGLRYEYTSPLAEADNLFGDFVPNPSATASGLVQIGRTPGFDTLWKPDHKDFAPRVGLAWDVTGKGTTVVRAGTGIMYAYNATSGMLGNTNIAPNATPTATPFYNTNGAQVPGPAGATTTTAIVVFPANSLPWATKTPIFGSGGALACGEGKAPGVTAPAGLAASPAECSVGGFDPNIPMPKVYFWNMDIQHSFGANLSLDVAYVANHATDLLQQSNINQPIAGLPNNSPFAPAPLTSTGFVEQVRQPYYPVFPWIGQVRWDSNRDSSSYNSLQATLTKRVSHGLNFTATYVWAHAIDIVDGEFTGNNVQNSYNPGADRGNAGFDVRNRFTLTATWKVPGRKAPGQMLEGWQVNTVVFLLSRLPINPVDSTDDTSGTGVKLDRWTLVGNPKDFQWAANGAPGSVPCFGFAGSTFAKVNGCSPTLPAQCISAATAEPTNPNVPSTLSGTVPNSLPPGAPSVPANSGLFNLYKYGCYMNNGSVMVAPAQGTYGNMSRDELLGPGQKEWDMSVTKDWKLTERVTTQFRVEAFNLINSVQYAAPGTSALNFGNPATFNQSQATINLGGIAIAPGAPREIQLGLRFMF